MSSRFDFPAEISLEKPPYYELLLCKGEMEQSVGGVLQTFQRLGGELIKRNSTVLSGDTFVFNMKRPGAQADLHLCQNLNSSMLCFERLCHELYSIGAGSIDYFGFRMLVKIENDIPNIVPENTVMRHQRVNFDLQRTVGELCSELVEEIDLALDRALLKDLSLRQSSVIKEPLQDFAFYCCALAEMNVVGARSTLRSMKAKKKSVARPIPPQMQYTIKNYMDGRAVYGSS